MDAKLYLVARTTTPTKPELELTKTVLVRCSRETRWTLRPIQPPDSWHDPEAALYNSSIESGVTGWFVGCAPWLVTSSLEKWTSCGSVAGFTNVVV